MCGTDSLGYFYTCRQPACYHCRRRYITRQYRAAVERFGHSAKSDLAFFTVILGGADHPDEISEIISKMRSSLRNMFGKHRSRRSRWNEVELVGWVEVDALCADDMPLLGSDRAELVASLGLRLTSDRPTYVPTIHGIVSLNGLDHQEFRDALMEKWTRKYQVDVLPFYDRSTKEKSIFCTIRYALKRTCSSFLKGVDVIWPDSWLVEFELWQSRASRSFQSLKVSVGRKRPTKNDIAVELSDKDSDFVYEEQDNECDVLEAIFDDDEDNYILPMPITF